MERKMMTLNIFQQLDKSGQGTIPIEELLRLFNATAHPSVADGVISPSQASKHFLFHFAQEKEGIARYTEFLDYYKGLSIAIDDDHEFENILRMMWCASV